MIHYNYAARHEAVWEIRGGMISLCEQFKC